MIRPTEQVVEDMAVYRLDGRGLPTCRGIEIDDGSERANASDVFLTTRVKSAVGKLNPHLPAATIDAVVASISRPPHPTLILNNRRFHGLLTDCVPVEYKDAKTGELRGARARLIDAWQAFSQKSPAVARIWIERLRSVDTSMVQKIIDNVPLQRMSQISRDFTLALLIENQNRLLAGER